MDLLKQCQQWFEQDEAQKVIDTLEAIPAEERTPELDSELAKAYIAVAHIGEREPFEKALELLAPHEEHFAEDHCWNYRIASAYYFLDEEGPALRYFEKALKARPGDKDTQEYIDDCRRRLSLPRFEKNFRERTQEAWADFSQIEGSLREIIDTDETHQRGDELIENCGNALKTALRDTSFELGFNGEKYELILSPEGLRSRLFPLVYFQKQAPESVLEHWNIWVGRQPSKDFMLRAGDMEIRAEDVQMWAEETEDQQVNLVLCCEKLTPILKEDTDRVWWALSMLVDQTIGEVSAIAFVAGFDVYAQPKDEPAMLLSELPELLQSMGLSLWRDGSDYLENSYLTYELEPVEDPEADWRLDVYTGTCRLPVIINDYLTARSDAVDEYHKDGIAVGFLCYPLEGFTGEERSKAILDFRDDLRDAILRDAGAEAVTFLGGATGLYCGYLDFIAWDLPAVLTAAQAFLEESGLPYAHFHAFRRDVGGVPLLDEEEPEPDIHEETGSLLSKEDIETLESFDEGVSGYFGKMLHWLEDFIKNGVEEGRFSEKQAHQDLQIALWYSFACNNLDDYIHYYQAAEWMKDSEKNAAGCATWYYRYSVALMYCGRLEEARSYAEKGAQEEPDYPWIWLQVGKLRAHFGDPAGALVAVERGLKLEPGDYEFLTLQEEIKAGATLEQMEYHWINPDADQLLQQGQGQDALVASDDGLNAAGGTDSSGTTGGRDGRFGGGPGGNGGGTGGNGGGMSSSWDGSIVISGGSLQINASGDGIDANGSVTISGGYTVVTGPTQGDTATLDYDVSAVITGGTFIGTGASGMAQTFSDSEQGVVSVSTGSQSAGTAVTLADQEGNTLITCTPEESFQVVILSSPDLVSGETYTVTVGKASAEVEAT